MAKHAKTGYCVGCAHNTEHERYVGPLVIATLHLVIRFFSGGGGYGPWYCDECRRICSFVQEPVAGRIAYAKAAVGGPLAAEVQSPLERKAGIAVRVQEKSGGRYSEKYRHGVARRMFREEATFKQISEEINVPKKEIWGWLVELFLNDQRRIEQLKRRVRYLEEALEQRVSADETVEMSGEWNGAASWSTIVVDAQMDESPSWSSSKFAR